MRVAINEAGQDGHVGEVDYCGAWRNFYGFAYCGEAIVADQHDLIAYCFARVNVYEAAGFDGGDVRRCGGGRCRLRVGYGRAAEAEYEWG